MVRSAIGQGARWVVLPEFFTTGIIFDDRMLDGHRPIDGEPMQMLRELAAKGDAAVAGSFLAECDGHVYNSFVLALPDGQVFTHDKDFPSGPIEHAYYAGGEDRAFVSTLREFGVDVAEDSIPAREDNNPDGVFDVSDGTMKVGCALCWEMIRQRTVNRLAGKVDFVLACSAWPSIDAELGFPGMNREQIVSLNDTLLQMLRNAPVQLAKLLGVPVVHANLVGRVKATKLFDQEVEYVTDFSGESQIVDSHGKTLARRPASEGEGLLVGEICLERAQAAMAVQDRFWIPELTPILTDLWYNRGAAGRQYYLAITHPHRTR